MNVVFKEALLAGLIGGMIAAVIAFVVAYFVVPAPLTLLDAAIGNGVSGFFSVLMSGFIGVFLALKKLATSKAAW